MNFHDGDRHFDQKRERGEACEQTEDNHNAAHKFGCRGEVRQPCRDSKRADELLVPMKSTEDFFVAVGDHDRAQRKTHHQQSEWLQSIERIQNYLQSWKQIR